MNIRKAITWAFTPIGGRDRPPNNPKLKCPHCDTRGTVYTRAARVKRGISGGKAAAAVFTGGASMLATGLSRKQGVTEAYCASCDMTWTIE